jgi:NCS1 family nucleobase:cation symporter-1
METIRRFENWAAPFVLVGAFVMLWWMADKAGGLGPLLDQPSKLGWDSDFWSLFGPALMGMIGFWSTLSLNIPDFTRYGKSQRAQTWGQTLGLPTTMTLFAFLSVMVTSGSQAVYGEPVWDPVQLAAKTDNVAGLVYALATVLVATLSVNIAANLVSPSFDFSNIAPRKVSFRTGALITAVLAVVIMPWKLYADPQGYIFTWLNLVAGLLGTVSGILIADYWLLRRTKLDLADLYRPGSGRYWYQGGWNWRAAAAFVVGGVLAVGGADFHPLIDGRPIPALSDLADYGWIVGLGTSLVLYLVLMSFRNKEKAAV